MNARLAMKSHRNPGAAGNSSSEALILVLIPAFYSRFLTLSHVTPRLPILAVDCIELGINSRLGTRVEATLGRSWMVK